MIANELGLVVACEIRECGRFAVDDIENEMTLPVARLALRIVVPPGLLAGEANNYDVVPAILVHIIHEREKIVREALRVIGLGFVILPAIGERRPGVPIRAGNKVHYAVAIEVAKRGAFAEEHIGKLHFLEIV
jgi:hypothetical protein